MSLSNFKPNICVPENMFVCLLAFPVLFSLLFSPSPASRGNLSYRASLQQWEQLCRHLKLVFWPKELGGVGPAVPCVWCKPHHRILSFFSPLYPKSSPSHAEPHGNMGIYISKRKSFYLSQWEKGKLYAYIFPFTLETCILHETFKGILCYSFQNFLCSVLTFSNSLTGFWVSCLGLKYM